MIHLGVRSIPKVLSWFQTQTAGTHTLTGTHWWYIGMLPLKLKVYPWPASSRAEKHQTLLWPKRRIEGGCSTSKTLACPEKMAPQKTEHQGNAKKKKLPGMRDTSWQMSLHFRLGSQKKLSVTKDVTRTTSCWGQLPYIPKVAAPLCWWPQKKTMLEPKFWVQKNRIKHQIFGKLSGILSSGVAHLPTFSPTSSGRTWRRGWNNFQQKLSEWWSKMTKNFPASSIQHPLIIHSAPELEDPGTYARCYLK